MKILFIYTNINVRGANFGNQPVMNLGIAGLSAYLKNHGHETDLLLAQQPLSKNEVTAKLAASSPDLVAFTSVTTQFGYVATIAQMIREISPDTKQICGGPHATLNPKHALQTGKFDAVCVGEGEDSLLEVVTNIERGRNIFTIPGIWAHAGRDSKIISNPPRPLVNNLDTLPFVDRLLYKDYIDLAHYSHSVLTTRGCPFGCTYCCNHAFKKIYPGKYVRSRSPANIMTEIEKLQQTYPELDSLYIEDETIGLNKRLWTTLLTQLRKTGLRLASNYRIGVCELEFLDQLRDSNFHRLNIGIESGNEWIRKHILKRNYSNTEIAATFQRAKQLGIETKSYNLIGLPEETAAHFIDTISINRQVQPDFTILNIFFPYPGTELAEYCLKKGLKWSQNTEFIKERVTPSLDLPGFPHDELIYYFQNWDRLIRTTPPHKRIQTTSTPHETQATQQIKKKLEKFSHTDLFNPTKKIALYGAGLHTRRLLSLRTGLNIKVIFDDHPETTDIEEIPVLTTDETDKPAFDVLLISSDIHEKDMSIKAKKWCPAGIPVLSLYERSENIRSCPKPSRDKTRTNLLLRRQCPACGSFHILFCGKITVNNFCNVNPAYSLSAYKTLGFHGNEQFTILMCENCGMSFVREILPDRLLYILYEQVINPETCRSREFSAQRIRQCVNRAKRIQNATTIINPGSLKLLDFGAGWGAMCTVCSGMGFDVLAYEIGQAKTHYLRTLDIPVANCIDDIKKAAPFDAIYANQVLEHTVYPFETLHLLHNVLASDGALFLTVPIISNDELRQQIKLSALEKAPKELNPWEHLNYFDKNSLTKLMSAIGFEESSAGAPFYQKRLDNQ